MAKSMGTTDAQPPNRKLKLVTMTYRTHPQISCFILVCLQTIGRKLPVLLSLLCTPCSSHLSVLNVGQFYCLHIINYIHSKKDRQPFYEYIRFRIQDFSMLMQSIVLGPTHILFFFDIYFVIFFLFLWYLKICRQLLTIS